MASGSEGEGKDHPRRGDEAGGSVVCVDSYRLRHLRLRHRRDPAPRRTGRGSGRGFVSGTGRSKYVGGQHLAWNYDGGGASKSMRRSHVSDVGYFLIGGGEIWPGAGGRGRGVWRTPIVDMCPETLPKRFGIEKAGAVQSQFRRGLASGPS
ncbi:hypothetical protein K440DRAFT_642457 [Wilcoxina mikolae CBS 423.85]|nr:hypothetical protein K440DRAFT_642457 [Wilcoxina mikolae CBS 423.85]